MLTSKLKDLCHTVTSAVSKNTLKRYLLNRLDLLDWYGVVLCHAFWGECILEAASWGVCSMRKPLQLAFE